MADGERPKGVCPECGRTISGRAEGPEPDPADRKYVRLRPHDREWHAKRPVTCLMHGERRVVPRITGGDVGLRAARQPWRPVRRPAAMSDPGWTIDMACAEFKAAGIPVTTTQLRGIIRYLPGLARIGETRKPAGSKGGRGDPLYPIRDLQELVTGIEPWVKPPASGDT